MEHGGFCQISLLIDGQRFRLHAPVATIQHVSG
jgi:hypothetical protein